MERITDRDLNRRVETVNSLLGFDTEQSLYTTVSAVDTYHAYGSVSVVINTEGGGTTILNPLGTKREAFTFLNGLIKGLDMARKMV